MLVAFVAAVVALAGGSLRSTSPTVAARTPEQQGRAAQHREELFSAKGTGDQEGPASWADQLAALNAYPDASITPDEIAAAQSADATLRGVGKGKNSTSSWYSLGPTNAVYPAVLNRHGLTQQAGDWGFPTISGANGGLEPGELVESKAPNHRRTPNPR